MTTPMDAADEAAESRHAAHHQKAALTAQMIGIISARLDALRTLVRDRAYGLECDLRVHSDHCSKLVPPPADPYESRASAGGRAKAVSATQLASNQAMLERLFGPDDKNRLRTQLLKKNKAELQKNEHRRNARAQLEKQLQASVEGHITRTVDNYLHAQQQHQQQQQQLGGSSPPGSADGHGGRGGAPPTITVNARLLLLHTCERMRIAHGKKNFKRFLLSELSCALFEDIFWLVFAHFFQKHSTAHQRALVDAVSARYVKVLGAVRGNGDYIFRVFPYALASGVCWGFHYLFPGSRHLYSPDFKNDVYLFVAQLLLGLKLCPVSVQAMRRQFFPEEMLDDLTFKSKSQQTAAIVAATTPETTTAAAMPDLSALLPRLLLHSSPSAAQLGSTPSTPSSLLPRARSEAYLAKQSLSENSVDKILGVAREREPGMAGAPEGPRAMRAHQLRTYFNAAQLSPLMKEYLGGVETRNLKKPCYLLRTTPFADCAVGGEDTFRKHYRRQTHKSFAADAQREQDTCLREVQRVQLGTRRELATLHETREIVLNSGKKAVQAYCTLLLSRGGAGNNGGPDGGGGADDAGPTGAGPSAAPSPLEIIGGLPSTRHG